VKRSDDPKFRLIDKISVTKLNYRLYAVVLIVGVCVLYLVVVQYLIHNRIQHTTQPINIQIIRNSIEQFGDGSHPLVIITVTTQEESVITLYFNSSLYDTVYNSGDYMTNYTVSAILPKSSFSTLFDIRVSALDKKGRTTKQEISLTTAKIQTSGNPDVKFRID